MRSEWGHNDIHAELLRRATVFNRRLIGGVLAIAVVLALSAVIYIVLEFRGTGIVGGFMLGVWSAVWFSFTFIASLAVGYVASRRLVAARVRLWCAEAIKLHGLEPDSFDYLIAMFAKATPKNEFGRPRRR